MTCTQAKVSKQQIYNAYANFCLFHRDYIFRIKEPYIQEAMKRTFWQKILGKPALSREEAITSRTSNPLEGL